MIKTRDKTQFLLWTGLVFAIIATVFFVGRDYNDIIKWYALFDECLIKGQLTDYAAYLEAYGASNYSLFSNVIGGIWLLPVYGLSMLRHYGSMLVDSTAVTRDVFVIWSVWHKVLILIVTLVSLKIFNKILDKLNYGQCKYLADFIYLTNAMVFISSVGSGQIDCFAIMFMLLGIYFFIDEKYILTTLMMSFSLMYKGMPIMVYLPVMALIFFPKLNWKKLGCMTLAFVSVPAVNMFFEKVVFTGYHKQRSDFQNDIDFFRRMFVSDYFTNGLLLVAGVVCVIAFYLSESNRVKKEYYLLFPLIVLTGFEILVRWNPQWLLMLIPFMILAGCYVGFSSSFLLSMFFFSLGFALSVPITDGMGYDDNGMLHNGILYLNHRYEPDIYMAKWLNAISPHIMVIGHTILEIGVVGILAITATTMYRRINNKDTATNTEFAISPKLINRILIFLQMIPSLGFLIGCFALLVANNAVN